MFIHLCGGMIDCQLSIKPVWDAKKSIKNFNFAIHAYMREILKVRLEEIDLHHLISSLAFLNVYRFSLSCIIKNKHGAIHPTYLNTFENY